MFNFKNGTSLAIQQDAYLKRYLSGGKFSEKEIRDMEQNVWVATASKMAPNNLVIRQYALIDLIKGNPSHGDKIVNIANVLTYRSQEMYKLWAEGYSYYCYTRDIVDIWVSKFRATIYAVAIQVILNGVDAGFFETSYKKGGILYPAPFGDLRDEPLKNDLQKERDFKPITIGNVAFKCGEERYTFCYSISGAPIGLNTHIPKNNSTVNIADGIVSGFKFYEGYDKKYRNSFEEFKDTFDPKRVASVYRC